MTRQPPHIVIAGGGVAAVEAVAALRALAGPLPRITAARARGRARPARRPRSRRRSASARPSPLPYEAIQRHARFDLHRGTLARVEPEEHVAVDEHGEAIALRQAAGGRRRAAAAGRAGRDHVRRPGGRAGGRARARGDVAARVRRCPPRPAGRCRSTSSRSWPPSSCATAARARDHGRDAGARAAVGVRRRGERGGRRAARRARDRAAHRRAGPSRSATACSSWTAARPCPPTA